jgi:hypothetical protein
VVKRLLYITVALSLVLTSFSFLLPPNEAQAAGPLSAQVVDYQSGDMLFTMPDGSSFGSKQLSVTPNEVTINNPSGDPISKVELRDANTHTVLQEMVSVGGNKYKASAPLQQQGQIVVGTPLYVTLNPGYFQWFRDPNQKVWMFDYDDSAADGGLTHRFYRNKDNAVYPAPPPTSCLQHKQGMPYGTLPVYPSGYESTVTYCDSAYDYREGTLNVTELNVLSAPTLKINFSDAVHVEFNTTDFQLDDSGTLSAANITGLSTDYIDVSTRKYRFNFTTLFSTTPDEPPDDTPDGRVLTWYSNWKIKLTGYVYSYPKLQAVAYTSVPTVKTDLSVPDLTGPSCIEAGTIMTYTYKITNSGPATSNAFKVKISADGTEIITQTFASGIGKETKSGTFSYKFSAAGDRSITVFADSDHALDEDSTSNNSKTVVFTAKADCSGGGGTDPGGCSLGSACPGTLTGTLTVHYPEITWKNMNDFQVTINNPASGCAAAKGRFTVSQGSNQYAYGWTTITNSDTAPFAWGMDHYSGYPGDIVEGSVRVIYTVQDTCGQYSIIGPGNFIIVKPAASKPTVELDWYSQSTGTKITEAVQDDYVFLKASKSDSNNENVTLAWNFTSSTPWTAGLPSKYGWATPMTAIQYSGIQAEEKGTHKVCVVGTNESGLSSSSVCAYLDVVGPEPVAVIDVSGTLKEDRRIRVDGGRSTSPKNLDLTYAWTIAPVAGETAAVQSDIQTIAPLTGVKKDFKTPKLGHYKVTLVVTDTVGLTGTAAQMVDVAIDLPPVATIAGNSVTSRQLADRGLAIFTLLGSALSVDSDIISKRYWSFTYDANNDGVFNESETVEIDEDALNLGWEYTYYAGSEPFIISKTGNHIVNLKGSHVGKYRTNLRVIEIPGQPTDLQY